MLVRAMPDPGPALLAYPNVSEGRDASTVEAVTRAFGEGLLDVHTDVDHNRSAFTLAGSPGRLAARVFDGARAAIDRIEIDVHDGVHPRVGAVDVAPIVYIGPDDRGAAAAEALVLADRLGDELGLPVFLYGTLGGGRTRAHLRRGGSAGLARRIEANELKPDFGPPRLHPTAGAVLVAARPPLVAFNVELAPDRTLDQARALAAEIREGGSHGLPGVRAIGLWLDSAAHAQVSTNVEDYRSASPRDVVEAIAALVGRGAIRNAELVGLSPEAAFADFPSDVPLTGLQTIEDALARRSVTA
jgi:glutamate formiminotransferase / 5-formyltetrahydrofolate cyclo-ligase